MSKIVNTVIVIILLISAMSSLLYIAVNSTIDIIEFNNIKTMSLLEFETEYFNKEKKSDIRFIRLKNVLAYYYYSIKTYNSFTGPNSPTAIYFPAIDPSKVDYRSNLNLFEKFKVIIRDTNYNVDIIKEKKEMTLSIISFNARVIKTIPEIVTKQIYSDEFRKKFGNELIYLEKDASPLPLWFVIIFYSLAIFVLFLIILILKKGGIEIIKVTKGSVKVKNIKDNIGDI